MLLLLVGCSFQPVGAHPKGTDPDDPVDTATRGRSVALAGLFPYDGRREAEYVQEDLDGVLTVRKAGVGTDGGPELVDWDWTLDGAAVGTLTMSASEAGVAIHAWQDADGTTHPCDPPIALTETGDRLFDDAAVVTTTAGSTFAVTLVGREDCPVTWGLDWEDCVRVRIDDGDGDDTIGPFFAGDYWLVERYGPAWMHVTGQTNVWDLARYEWSAE